MSRRSPTRSSKGSTFGAGKVKRGGDERMTTLAHPRTDGYGRPGGPRAGGRALLERAVADAPSHVPPPAGWLRRLFARDQSAAALIRRYRLWPGIEHAYERITCEMGPLRVE